MSDTPRTNAEDELLAIIRYAEDGYALECLRKHVATETSQLRATLDNPHAVHAHYLRIGNGWEVWTSERVRGMDRENETLRAQLAEARKDTERLDWLSGAKCAEFSEGCCAWRINMDMQTDRETLRQAIDAAINNCSK